MNRLTRYTLTFEELKECLDDILFDINHEDDVQLTIEHRGKHDLRFTLGKLTSYVNRDDNELMEIIKLLYVDVNNTDIVGVSLPLVFPTGLDKDLIIDLINNMIASHSLPNLIVFKPSHIRERLIDKFTMVAYTDPNGIEVISRKHDVYYTAPAYAAFKNPRNYYLSVRCPKHLSAEITRPTAMAEVVVAMEESEITILGIYVSGYRA